MSGEEGNVQMKLPRIAKGKKPTYFDPTVDKLLSMVLSLTGELSVVRDRLDTVERLLEKHGVFGQQQIDSFEPSDEIITLRSKQRAAYLDRVLRAVQSDLETLSQGDQTQGSP